MKLHPLLLAACLLAAPASAQSIAIVHAHILSEGAAGEIPSGTLVLKDGKIAALGAGLAVPADAIVIDAKGGPVTPGFIAPDAQLGLVEVGQEPSTVDLVNYNDQLSAAFDVEYGLNPYSVPIPAARLGGITRAIATPGYADERPGFHPPPGRQFLFAGQAAAIHLGAAEDILVKPKVAMVLALGESGSARAGGARGAAIGQIESVFDDVRWYESRRDAYDKGASRPLSLSRADLEALVPVVHGTMPVLVYVHRAADIHEVLRLAQRERLRVILDGAEEGWKVAGEIAAAHVPVILGPLDDLPATFESIGATLDNAAALRKAGVLIAFHSSAGGSFRIRELRYDAGVAAAHGLSRADALAAVTINPARIFGLDGQAGSLDPGKEGDVVVWSGDPFEPYSQPVAIFIRGRQQSLGSRADDLAARYRTRPAGGYPPQYR